MGDVSPRPRRFKALPTVDAGRILGLPLRVHASAMLLPLLVFPLACVAYGECRLGALLFGAALGSIVLHELGHALVARRLGVQTVDLTLYVMGGVLRVARPMEPRDEWRVAMAGPLVNGLLAAGGLGTLAGLGEAAALLDVEGASLGVKLLVGFTWLNVVLCVFNLFPAYPMDGGRILKSRLTSRLGPERGLRAAALSGQILGTVVLLAAPALGSIWLAMIALTLIIAARRESRLERWIAREDPLELYATGRLFSVEVSAGATLLEASRILEERGADTLVLVDPGAEEPGLRRSASRHELFQAMRRLGPYERVGALVAPAESPR